ncbi:MAG TPA: hypothetical protein VGE84_07500, partial [Allosphingosinicella sp.]
MHMRSAFGLTAGLLALATAAGAAEAPSNPLDALTGPEIDAAVGLLSAAGKVSDATRYPTVTLIENSKASVLAWQPGQPFERRARVVYFQGGHLFEADVNLSRKAIGSVTEVKDR